MCFASLSFSLPFKLRSTPPLTSSTKAKNKGKLKDGFQRQRPSRLAEHQLYPTSSTSSSLESKLLVCKQNQLFNSKTEIPKPDKKSNFSSLPKSQVLGKVKYFLGVISEANEKLQLDAKDNSEKYDIEVLEGDESEYIEMDLVLGVADLQTPETIAAAESAIASH